MSVFAGPDIAASVLMMRAFNALLFVGITSALFFLLTPSNRGPLLWGGLATIVPLGMFLVPSVNPSSWAVTSAMTLWISVLAFLTASDTRRRIVFGTIAVLMTIAAAGSRGDAAAYSALAILIVTGLVIRKSRSYLRFAALPFALIVVCGVFFLSAGQSSVVGFDSGGDNAGSRNPVELSILNLTLLPGLWTGALGSWGLGWLDTHLPPIVWVSTLAAFLGLLFWGVQRLGKRKAVALAIVMVSLVVIPLYVLVKDNVLVGSGVQPRYIYPLMIMLVGLAVLGFDRDDLRLSRFQQWVIGILVVVANTVALHTNIRRYVTGTDEPGANLDSGAEWWWSVAPSPMTVWIVGSIAFAMAVLGILLYTFRQRHDDEVVSVRRGESAWTPGSYLLDDPVSRKD